MKLQARYFLRSRLDPWHLLVTIHWLFVVGALNPQIVFLLGHLLLAVESSSLIVAAPHGLLTFGASG